MKFNKWTVGLAAVGVVSLASAARADEKMNAVQTALSNTTLSGYVDTAATWRPGTDSGPNTIFPNLPAYAFAKNDGFSLNAVDIALDKPEDESPWAAGYHVELMIGPDSIPLGNVAIGGVSIGGIGGGAGLTSLRQAYVTLRTPVGNGIDWKVGVFDTIIGYESTSDPLDPNYTRSYGYSIEPTTHTGILATYKVNDMLSVSAGMANTWNADTIVAGGGSPKFGLNNTAQFESQKTYMGSIAFTAPDSAGFMKGATLTVGVVNGIDSLANGAGSMTSFYTGLTVPTPVSALKVGAAFDFFDLHNGGVPGNSSDDSTWVIGLYSSLQATDKLSFNMRAEYLSSNGSGLYDIPGVGPGTSPDNVAEEFTATAQYNLWANVISRVEFRWDHAEHQNFFGYSSGALTAGAPNRNNDFLLALNLIYQF
jgi:hypothetical protein